MHVGVCMLSEYKLFIHTCEEQQIQEGLLCSERSFTCSFASRLDDIEARRTLLYLNSLRLLATFPNCILNIWW